MDMKQLFNDFKEHVELLSNDKIRESIATAIAHVGLINPISVEELKEVIKDD